MNDRHGLIVLSGGMDSVTLLYEYRRDIALAVSFDYGSKHNARELPFARLHCERLVSGGAIPKGRYDEENMASTVVPFRNGIMLSIAAGLAESRGLRRVYIANHFGDHAIYPDCRSSFIRPMHEAIYEGTGNHVAIAAPYTDLTKAEIAAHGKSLGIDYAETWSCYEGDSLQCGTCGTCIERREAMQTAGIIDPTPYKE